MADDEGITDDVAKPDCPAESSLYPVSSSSSPNSAPKSANSDLVASARMSLPSLADGSGWFEELEEEDTSG